MGAKLQDLLSYPPRGMDAAHAAAYCGLSRTKFLDLVTSQMIPPAKDLGGVPRWDRLELDRYWDALEAKSKPAGSSKTSIGELLDGVPDDGDA